MTTAPRRSTRTERETSPVSTDWGFIEQVLRSPNVRTVYLWGPPGLGKTYSAFNVGSPGALFAITLTEDTPAAELRGHYLPRGHEMVWHDGPIISAMRVGGTLVINELTHGTPEAMSLLHPVLENLATARLTLPTNETVFPAPGFRVVCTDNAAPEDLPAALRDRFDVTLEVREPHPAALALLGERLRGAAIRSFQLEPDRRVSLRGWLSVQRLEPELGLKGACEAVFGRARGAMLHDALLLAEAQN